jgi:hypothetical protein
MTKKVAKKAAKQTTKKPGSAATDLSSENQNYRRRKATWVKRRKEFEERTKATGAHAESTFPRVAQLARGGAYRANGYFYIKDKAGRKKAYQSPSSEGLKQAVKKAQGDCEVGDAEHVRRYTYDYHRVIGSGKQYNFFQGKMPYSSEAHHLIPIEAIPKVKFTEDQLELLCKLPFNINHGENIILLPKYAKHSPIHALPQHSGSHPKYNALVASDLSKLCSQLTAKETEDCGPEDPPPIGVLNALIASESDYWKLLTAEGPMNIKERALAALASREAEKSGV